MAHAEKPEAVDRENDGTLVAGQRLNIQKRHPKAALLTLQTVSLLQQR